MTGTTRRAFLRQTAAAVTTVSAFGALPAVIRRALATEPHRITGTIQDVKHVVILMQENRSFDHYFGTMSGVRGFGDRFPIPLENGKSVWHQSDGTGEVMPYHLDHKVSNALLVPGTPHTFADAQAAWNQGKFGQWPLYKSVYSMGHYQREDIPFQFALAEAFTICDSYHCSLTTGTDPNRIMFWSGSNYDPAIGRSGVNCTSANSEPNNLRCWIEGIMPSPGYTYNGSAFTWPTLPDLLQAAGVSWRIYQNPNDNWSGAMHGCLAFQTFREATAQSGSPLYENGMRHWSLQDLRNDVMNGSLPSVSWILPSTLQSEHPSAGSSPARGGAFVAEILDALTSNEESWAKTAFFLTFDENDGFFDHVPAPAVPSIYADGSLAGKSTVPLAGEYFSDPEKTCRLPGDTIAGDDRPWGLGARVPMYAVSPWSRGGWVNSQVFDHTSIGMFLERRFGITVNSISPWHRAICGDLTSLFDFSLPVTAAVAPLPNTSNFAEIEAWQRSLPAPTPPAVPEPLFQETGVRLSRALPYEIHTSGRLKSASIIRLTFSNTGQQGAVFHVYDKRHLDRIPRRYTVESTLELHDDWDTTADDGAYDLWVYSTNGFVRAFEGNTLLQSAAEFAPEIQVCYQPSAGRIHLKVHNLGISEGMVTVTSNAYRDDGPWALAIPAATTGLIHWNLANAWNWYDFTVSANHFTRRFAGRMETGHHGVSDPAMGVDLASALAAKTG